MCVCVKGGVRQKDVFPLLLWGLIQWGIGTHTLNYVSLKCDDNVGSVSKLFPLSATGGAPNPNPNPNQTLHPRWVRQTKAFYVSVALPGNSYHVVLLCICRRAAPLEERWTVRDVQCAVVALLGEMSQSKLAKLSPLSQVTKKSPARF